MGKPAHIGDVGQPPVPRHGGGDGEAFVVGDPGQAASVRVDLEQFLAAICQLMDEDDPRVGHARNPGERPDQFVDQPVHGPGKGFLLAGIGLLEDHGFRAQVRHFDLEDQFPGPAPLEQRLHQEGGAGLPHGEVGPRAMGRERRFQEGHDRAGVRQVPAGDLEKGRPEGTILDAGEVGPGTDHHQLGGAARAHDDLGHVRLQRPRPPQEEGADPAHQRGGPPVASLAGSLPIGAHHGGESGRAT